MLRLMNREEVVHLQGVQDGLCLPCHPSDLMLLSLLECLCLVLPERQGQIKSHPFTLTQMGYDVHNI